MIDLWRIILYPIIGIFQDRKEKKLKDRLKRLRERELEIRIKEAPLQAWQNKKKRYNRNNY